MGSLHFCVGPYGGRALCPKHTPTDAGSLSYLQRAAINEQHVRSEKAILLRRLALQPETKCVLD
ncbi:unnamed protein product, partial [Boreogadus saida]